MMATRPATTTKTLDIKMAHSPDSDDAFMFYALATNRVKAPGLKFSHVLADIETLNQAADRETYDVTAISFSAYAFLREKYVLLDCGASFGENYGPLVVASHPMKREDLVGARIGMPLCIQLRQRSTLPRPPRLSPRRSHSLPSTAPSCCSTGRSPDPPGPPSRPAGRSTSCRLAALRSGGGVGSRLLRTGRGVGSRQDHLVRRARRTGLSGGPLDQRGDRLGLRDIDRVAARLFGDGRPGSF